MNTRGSQILHQWTRFVRPWSAGTAGARLRVARICASVRYVPQNPNPAMRTVPRNRQRSPVSHSRSPVSESTKDSAKSRAILGSHPASAAVSKMRIERIPHALVRSPRTGATNRSRSPTRSRLITGPRVDARKTSSHAANAVATGFGASHPTGVWTIAPIFARVSWGKKSVTIRVAAANIRSTKRDTVANCTVRRWSRLTIRAAKNSMSLGTRIVAMTAGPSTASTGQL